MGIAYNILPETVSHLKKRGLLSSRRGIHLPQSNLFHPSEAAAMIGIGRSTINAMVAHGEIFSVTTPSGYHLFSQSEIDRVIKSRVSIKFNDLSLDPLWCAWLSGFTDGEGSFSIAITESRRKYPEYHARFQLFQRTDHRDVLETTQRNLQCGSLYDRQKKGTSGKGSYFVVQDLQNLYHIIIPLFQKYPLFVKPNVFAVWSEVVSILYTVPIELRDTARLKESRELLRKLYAYQQTNLGGKPS